MPQSASSRVMPAQYYWVDVPGGGLVAVAIETETADGAATGALSCAGVRFRGLLCRAATNCA